MQEQVYFWGGICRSESLFRGEYAGTSDTMFSKAFAEPADGISGMGTELLGTWGRNNTTIQSAGDCALRINESSNSARVNVMYATDQQWERRLNVTADGGPAQNTVPNFVRT